MKNFYFRRYIPLAAAAAVLFASFFLPNIVAGVLDARRIHNSIVVDAQSISFDTVPHLSLTERIAFAASPNTDVMSITTGQVMGAEMAESAALREITEFFSRGEFIFAFDDCVVESGGASFVIDSEDPSVNMIIWEFRVVDRQSNEITVTIDDETGIILRLLYYRRSESIRAGESDGGSSLYMFGDDVVPAPGLSDDEMRGDALLLVDMMAEYYGQPVGLGDYQLSGNIAYYRADMRGGGLGSPAIFLYGVVRATGFTMNERV